MDLTARERPLVIGHRGASNTAPANSLAGLQAAVDAGADLVEIDVDETLHLGHPGEAPTGPAPSLAEALAALEPETIGIQVDLKARGIEAQVAQAIRASPAAQRVIVSSAWARSVRRLRTQAPQLTCVVSYPRDRAGVGDRDWPAAVQRPSAWLLRAVMPWRARLLLRESRASVLAVHHLLVSGTLIAAMHQRGVAVIAWTVNDPSRILELAALGVDAVTSDDPAMALGVLGTLRKL